MEKCVSFAYLVTGSYKCFEIMQSNQFVDIQLLDIQRTEHSECFTAFDLPVFLIEMKNMAFISI